MLYIQDPYTGYRFVQVVVAGIRQPLAEALVKSMPVCIVTGIGHAQENVIRYGLIETKDLDAFLTQELDVDPPHTVSCYPVRDWSSGEALWFKLREVETKVAIQGAYDPGRPKLRPCSEATPRPGYAWGLPDTV
jgi:hypothetical protein